MGKLIRLELFNFKSYKGHHTLLFGDSYFTSIIGPNGSGKSNSMDAISFVLGIKSSQLRSTQLKDLVYRGRVLKISKINDDGSAAAPGANGQTHGPGDGDDEDASHRASRNDPKSAWVMAVYEDDAGDEQRWKRTITSQGSSEYRINDRVVTAAQYNEALEAENILIKARNFLVFQGDVEAIAAQSPQDLTRLIEQISGSLEFKAEYERLQAEAEQAAENQNHQLHRRRGINSEIKQYQEQKKEAENFQKKTEERDDAIVAEILWKLFHFQRGMDEDNAQIREHQDNLKEFRRNVEASEKKLEMARKEQVAASRQVAKVERDITSKERSIRATEPELGKFNEKVAQSVQSIDRVHARIIDVSKEKEKLADSIKKAQKDLATVEKAQEQYEKEQRERMKAQGKALTESDRKEYGTLRAEARTKTSKNMTSLEQLTRQEKMDEATVNSYKGDIDSSTSKLEKLESDLRITADQKDKVESDIKKLAQDIGGKKKEFTQIQSDRTRTNHLRTELEEKLEGVAKKLKEADDQARQTKNERRMKEMVTDLKRTFPGVKGRVGDLCKPKQKKFDEAVIIALGREFDSIVVDTEKTATECIQYLKEGKRPPATFLPLDNIKVDAVNTSIKGIPGARLTIDAIDFDSSVERAISYACGSSVVCDNLTIAKQIKFERKIQVKAVTIDGFVIHKAGLMTGGRGPENKGGKRRFEEHDVENLQRSAQKLKDELERLPKSDRRGKQEEDLQHELASLERRLRNAENELAALDKNQKSAAKERDSERKKLAALQPKFAELQAKLESSQRSVKKFQDAISQVEDEVFSKFCRRLGYPNIREYEAQQGSMEQEAAEKRSQFEVQKHRLHGQLATAESQYQTTEARIAKLQEELRRLDRDVKSYKKEKVAVERQVSEEQDELAALEESIEELKEELSARSQKVAEARSEVQKRNKDIEARQKEITALEAAMQKKSASRFGLLRRCKLEQVQIPLLEGSLDQLPSEDNLLQQDPDAMDVDDVDDDELIQAALEDHGIEIDFEGLDDGLKTSDDPSVEETLQDKITSLTAELEKLNPNMRAIERLESVEARLKSTEKDFEDSRLAAKAARDAFSAVKAQRFELFNKAFTHIKEQISHVYKDLTRSDAYPLGGTAYLDVEEDTDTPYLSGIKYHAMPPLKRFREMDLLSGGEKTMAALALLFAIHSYQPSPFFVLDEVDAALDNANVGMVKKYIREHAGPGMQFVVISLKPTLFQDSESLIGVYRDQDVNSSRTLTLDLRKYA